MKLFVILFTVCLCLADEDSSSDDEYIDLKDVDEFEIGRDELMKFRIEPGVNRYRIVGSDYQYCGATPDYTYDSVSPDLYFHFYCSDFAQYNTSHILSLYMITHTRYSSGVFKNITYTISQ